MPITYAQPGKENRIQRITGNDEIRRFLYSLGFVEGELVTIIAECAGNLIVQIKGSRVAVDRDLASRIIV